MSYACAGPHAAKCKNGFSNKHSSLVTNVKNLRTGYVSLQYNIVFDVPFLTLFSSGEINMVVDAICNQLFKTNLDINEYNELSIDRESIFLLLLWVRFGSLNRALG